MAWTDCIFSTQGFLSQPPIKKGVSVPRFFPETLVAARMGNKKLCPTRIKGNCMAKTLNQFCKDAIAKFEENPIDALFCYIQCDKQLMKDYLDVVAESRDLRNVNSGIAKALAVHYGTKSRGDRDYEPNSTLIQSYSLLEEVNQ